MPAYSDDFGLLMIDFQRDFCAADPGNSSRLRKNGAPGRSDLGSAGYSGRDARIMEVALMNLYSAYQPEPRFRWPDSHKCGVMLCFDD
jgi:hypothetical protein